MCAVDSTSGGTVMSPMPFWMFSTAVWMGSTSSSLSCRSVLVTLPSARLRAMLLVMLMAA